MPGSSLWTANRIRAANATKGAQVFNLSWIASLLVIIGAINWGLIGITDENVLANIIDEKDVLDIIYIAIGVAGAISIPRLLR